MNEVNLQQKIENEMAVLRGLIERYRRYEDSESICMVVAYEYGLQVLMDLYEMSIQKEVIPF
ncbi:hypothetical protein [Bacillus toyonensis]|uniref:hypothetical protein n=1 Tax=Bacillus toyonensis TaxID=155322 RepID=UPI000BFE4631|nr:hypothetical protein [Bacillus toyonensis]PHA39265.1 hypothetical protein COE68_23785 [Bacillus toyonensis]